MRFIAIAVLVVCASSSASGQSGYTYDPSSGNSYSTFGNTTHGWNHNTGAQWRSTTYGSQTFGTDSNGNTWNYNSNTGMYQNYGTGVTCFGQGVYRTCTK